MLVKLIKVTHINTVPILPNNITKSVLREVEQAGRAKKLAFNLMLNTSIILQKINTNFGLKVAQKIFKNLLDKIVGPQVKCIIIGGSQVPYETLKVINGLGYFTTCGFGMTEVGITSCESSHQLQIRLSGSLGASFKYNEYKIEGDKEVGELLVRGKAIHQGRLVDGQHLAAELNEEGWFATGDIGRLKNGRLQLEGRVKDIIINESGENVYPDEIEDYFSKLPLYNQLSVLGTKKADNYQYITLVLNLAKSELNEENYMKLRDAINKINGSLPIMKRVNKAYLTSHPLPVVNGIKVRRVELKKLIENKEISMVELDLKGHSFELMEAAKKDHKVEEVYEKEFEEIKNVIRKAFSEVLHLPEESIEDDAHFIDDLDGDSLSSISLLVKVEEKYDIVIPDSEYYNCTNVNNLALLILKKKKALWTIKIRRI